jgi:hypothetical protein
MSAESQPLRQLRRKVRRLLASIEQALEASREVERARDDLVRAAGRLPGLRIVDPAAGSDHGEKHR